MSTATTSSLGRTPGAILLFATCHQALGVSLLVLTAMIVQTEMIGTLRDFDWASASVLLLLLTLSLPRCIGGMTLRRTGKRAWRLSVVCFALAAGAEVITAALGTNGLVKGWQYSTDRLVAMAYVAVATMLLMLSGVVLSYLSTTQAGTAFAMPAEPPPSRLVRSLPQIACAAWLAAVAAGALLAFVPPG